MTEEKLRLWVGISFLPAIGAVGFKRILNKIENLENFFTLSKSALIKLGFGPMGADKIIEARKELDLDRCWNWVKRENIKLLTYFDNNYPKLLQEIYDFPPLLYYRGELPPSDQLTVAIVGTRKPSPYGVQVTAEIISGLVKSEVAIVSGLALGIDSEAHRAAVLNKGKTIAVLGSGLDYNSIYPRENKRLVEDIVNAGGCVLTEFCCGTPGYRQNFPQRNRIISGLSIGTLVVEAQEGSGALITAQCALDQNREVFAVPGSINSLDSFGPNNLIKQGAKVVLSANDILETLDLNLIKENIAPKKIVAENKEEENLLQFLSQEPTHIDQLILQSGLDSGMVNSTLIIMEVAGKVRNVGGGRYILG